MAAERKGKGPATVGPGPLIVYFDQMCMNAFGKDTELVQIEDLRKRGKVTLMANPRNYDELGVGDYAALARERLDTLSEGTEFFRLDISPMDFTPFGARTDIRALFFKIFPQEAIESATNSLHDVLHVANAEDNGGDVFITREKAILQAREKLGLNVRILSPTELLAELWAGDD